MSGPLADLAMAIGLEVPPDLANEWWYGAHEAGSAVTDVAVINNTGDEWTLLSPSPDDDSCTDDNQSSFFSMMPSQTIGAKSGKMTGGTLYQTIEGGAYTACKVIYGSGADRVAWSTHKPLIGANSGQTWGNVSIEVGSGMSLSEANVWIGGHS